MSLNPKGNLPEGGKEKRSTFAELFSSRPVLVLPLVFLGFIGAGTAFFMFPWILKGGGGLAFVDAFFLSASALTLTGLSTVDMFSLSLWGQILLLILIQSGILLILVLAMILGVTFADKVRQGRALEEILDIKARDYRLVFRIVQVAVMISLVFELVGAAILFPFFANSMGTAQAVFHALFYAASGYGNAGFSLTRDSLQGYITHPYFFATIFVLFVLGGLGIPIWFALKDKIARLIFKKDAHTFDLHAKLVLLGTAILLLAGAVFFFVFEYQGMGPRSLFEKIAISLFQSGAARTAGFTLVDVSQFSMPTYLHLMMLMFIGGAPLSLAGGIKITTMMLTLGLVVSFLKGKDEVEFFGRSIPFELVRKAFSIAVLSLLTIMAALLALLFVESQSVFPAAIDARRFSALSFEVVSAFSTVGLSTGITPHLSLFGKLIIIFLMVIGRLGPLMILYGVLSSGKKKHTHYPEERVILS